MGQSDGWTPDRYIDPAPHTIRQVSINNSRLYLAVAGSIPARYRHTTATCNLQQLTNFMFVSMWYTPKSIGSVGMGEHC